MKKTEAKSEKKSLVKRIIIIIMILFFLIIGCTSGFFGKVGRLFENFSQYIFSDNQKLIKIYNEELKFISTRGEVELDNIYKLEFITDEISSKEFTCITSDAEIATCIVKDNYVEVYPKKTGKVTVSVITEANGKEYIGTHKLTIKDVVREIVLGINNLNMYLNETKFSKIPFKLNNLNGTVEVSVSNPNVLKASVKNNTIEIISIAEGHATITISVKYNEKTYSNKINVNVYGKRQIYIKSSINSLNKITLSKGVLSPEFNKDVLNYKVNLESSISRINVSAIKTDSKSKVVYYFDDKRVASLSDLNLNYGENKVDIHVQAEDGTTKKYTIIINREVADNLSNINTLENITGISNFNKNTLNYSIELENSVSTISLSAIKTDSKSTLKYYIDGARVDSLSNISLVENIVKKIEVVVTSESGIKKTYIICLLRKDNGLSAINSLESLTIKNYNFDFDKNIKNYEVIVDYNRESIDLDYVLTSDSSSVSYKLNSNTITNIDAINLNEGVNTLEVTVKSESGVDNTYTITIKKPVRKVVLEKSINAFSIELGSVDVVYKVYEDKNIDDTWVLVNDYNLNDVSISISNFNGSYIKNRDYLTLNFSNLDINNTYTLIVSYLTKIDSTTFKVTMNDYYISILKDSYTFDLTDTDTNIILNTNIFNNDIEYTNIKNGIRMYNNKGYVDITSQDTNVLNVLSNSDNSNSTYIAFKLDLLNAGNVNINVTGKVYDREIINKNVTININKKYSVVIDANGGMFNAFTDKYEYLKEKNETILLSDFEPYKVDKTGNCLYYKIDSYNTLPNGAGTSYALNDIITITDDITLYAIYKQTSEYKIIEEEKSIYLTDVDLFYNEEYYEYYNVKKMIYPGANGSHVMYLENNTDSTITFKSFNIKENTTCNSNGCINMGYVVKYTKPNEDSWNYIYGSTNGYKILNSDSNANQNYTDNENSIKIDINDGMILNPGEKITVSILWEWVEVNDKLDTELGHIATEEYTITISLDYKEVNTYCILD